MVVRRTHRGFMAHYRPVYMGALGCALFAVAAATILADNTYLKGARGYASYAGLIGGILAVVLSAANFGMVRGRPWGVWVSVISCVGCLLVVLPTISYKPNLYIYIVGLLSPLLCLYLLNIKHHRQMRSELLRIRLERKRYQTGFRAPRTAELAQARLECKQARRRSRENRRKWKVAINPSETSHAYPAPDKAVPGSIRHDDFFEMFMTRYFPVFICAFFCAVFSLGASISLATSSYFRGVPDRGHYSALVAVGLSVLLTGAHFFMLRGRLWGGWVISVFCVVSFCVAAATFGSRPHLFSYITGLLFPLSGLYLLNTHRHREMRDVLTVVGQERARQGQR